MAEFEYRKKLEGWVEGVVDVFLTYLWTAFLMNFQPRKTVPLFKSQHDMLELSSPSIYLVLSYLVMGVLIQNVDFTDPAFVVNPQGILNALGALDAAKTAKLETLIVSILPVILLLSFLVILTTMILRLGGDNLEIRLLLRNYCYFLGSGFLAIGIISFGYHYVAKPVAMTSWSLGLAVHMLTLYFPLQSIMVPLAFVNIGEPGSRILTVRFVALGAIIVSIFVLTWIGTGSFYLFDYLKGGSGFRLS